MKGPRGRTATCTAVLPVLRSQFRSAVSPFGFIKGFRCLFFFFFNDTATTEIYTLSLHDALPICDGMRLNRRLSPGRSTRHPQTTDRKSTRLNSSHLVISYAVFCLKKKKLHHSGIREDLGKAHHIEELTRREATARTPPPMGHSTRTRSAPLFFFNDTATTEIYTLSLHDALPI